MSCGVGGRGGSGPTSLWRKPAAIAPIRQLAWELSYAAGAALKNIYFKKDINKGEIDIV